MTSQYDQAMRWKARHPKGTRQPMVFSTGSGFWPSGSFLEDYAAYVAKCRADGTKPESCEAHYRSVGGAA